MIEDMVLQMHYRDFDDRVGRIEVKQAPLRTKVAANLLLWWNEIGGRYCHPDVLSGEGLVVINATNGTFRYALDELDPDGYAWTAHRIYPEDTSCAAS